MLNKTYRLFFSDRNEFYETDNYYLLIPEGTDIAEFEKDWVLPDHRHLFGVLQNIKYILDITGLGFEEDQIRKPFIRKYAIGVDMMSA